MIARVWHGGTKPEHAAAYESHLKPELLPGLSLQKGFAAATCCAGRSAMKSSSSPSFCGIRSTTFALSRERTTNTQ